MTSTEDVDVIRYGVREETDMRVCLLNYRKNGTAFLNQFNLSPLRDTSGKLVREGGRGCLTELGCVPAFWRLIGWPRGGCCSLLLFGGGVQPAWCVHCGYFLDGC